jgi:hypothetical protein
MVMISMLRINRQFMFLNGSSLLAFSERILRLLATRHPGEHEQSLLLRLQEKTGALAATLNDPELKRKQRTDAIRAKSVLVLGVLDQLADHFEQTLAYKSDIFTTGFRPLTASRTDSETKRAQRLNQKKALIGKTATRFTEPRSV